MSEFFTGLQIKLAGLGAAPTAVLRTPAAVWEGDATRGRAMLRGIYRLAGQELSAPGYGPWKLTPPSPAFRDALHGFEWLGDFTLIPGAEPKREIRSWIYGWIAIFGHGEGEGWRPGLAGRRLMMWAACAPLALDGADEELAKRFYKAVAVHVRYLATGWKKAEDGRPRICALAGLLWAALAFDRCREDLPRHAETLGLAADRLIGVDGGIPSRNPEELAEIHLILAHAVAELEGLGAAVPDPLRAALDRIAPALRMLRCGDGRLARFHGGGAGPEGRLDQALTLARAPRTASAREAMGFRRMQGGRTGLILDAAPPPAGADAHASTLGLEMWRGAKRILVSAGPGAAYGADHAEQCRETRAHSAVTVGRVSSSRLGPRKGGPTPFAETPQRVTVEEARDYDGEWLLAAHDGFYAPFGVTHARRLFLSLDGCDFRGEDTIEALEDKKSRARFDKAALGFMDQGRGGLPFTLRFILHPALELTAAPGGALIAGEGERWRFHADGGAVALESTVWYERGASRPGSTKQIVVSARTEGYWGRVTWAFRREDASGTG